MGTSLAKHEEMASMISAAREAGERVRRIQVAQDEAIPLLAQSVACLLFESEVSAIYRLRVGYRWYRRWFSWPQHLACIAVEDPHYEERAVYLLVDRAGALYRMWGKRVWLWDETSTVYPKAKLVRTLVARLEQLPDEIQRANNTRESELMALSHILDAL